MTTSSEDCSPEEILVAASSVLRDKGAPLQDLS